jgi:hypothetical protein
MGKIAHGISAHAKQQALNIAGRKNKLCERDPARV